MSATDLDKWVKDEDAPACFVCKADFTLFRRRHHCRVCGNVICADCSSNTLPLIVNYGSSGNLAAQGALTPSKQKVCDTCYEKTQVEQNQDGENSCLDTSDEEDAQAAEDAARGRKAAQRILDAEGKGKKPSKKASSKDKLASLQLDAKTKEIPRSPTALGSVTNTVLPPSAIPLSTLPPSKFRSLYASNVEYLGPILHLAQLMIFSHPKYQQYSSCSSSFYEPFEAFPLFKYLQLVYRVLIIMSLLYWAIVGGVQVLMYMAVVYPFQLVFSKYLDFSGDMSLQDFKMYTENVIAYLMTYFHEGICATDLHSAVNNNWILSNGSFSETFKASFDGPLYWRIATYVFFLVLKCLFFVALTLPWKKLKTLTYSEKKKLA